MDGVDPRGDRRGGCGALSDVPEAAPREEGGLGVRSCERASERLRGRDGRRRGEKGYADIEGHGFGTDGSAGDCSSWRHLPSPPLGQRRMASVRAGMSEEKQYDTCPHVT